ncbi:MAG: tetratricopeptide repeat protein [Pseudomonadota bacterium]
MSVVRRRLRTVLAVRIGGLEDLLASANAADNAKAARLRAWFSRTVAAHGGEERNGGTDLLLAEFVTATQALLATLALTQGPPKSAEVSDCPLRAAFSVGEVSVDGQHMSGEAVLVATALTAHAHDGGAVVAASAYLPLRDRDDVAFLSLGEFTIDKIAHPIEGYRLTTVGQSRSLADIFSELGRRRVIRTASAYVVVAWLVVQASDIVLEAFEAPMWIQRALITLLAAGFPLAMLLTWSLNLSAEGLVRTPDTGYSKRVGLWLKTSVFGASVALSAALLWGVWTGVIAPEQEEQVAEARAVISPLEPANPAIVVMPFKKISGDESLDRFGQVAADLTRTSLRDTGMAKVYTMPALLSVERESGPDKTLAEAARDANADYLIAGYYYMTVDGMLKIEPQITRLADGEALDVEGIDANDPADALGQWRAFMRRVKRQLRLPTESDVGHLAANVAVANVSAYELYVGALEYLTLYDYENAEQLLEAALAEDPGFGIARYRLAQIKAANGEHEMAYAMLEQIDTENLSAREQHFISGAKHKFDLHRNLPEAIRIYQKLVADFPFDSESLQNLAEAHYLNFEDRESIRVLETLVEIHPREYVSWMALGERQLDLGLHAEAAKSLRTYLDMRPTDPYAFTLLGQLSAGEGDWQQALEYFEQALAQQPDMGIALIGKARTQFYAGDRDGALLTWRSVLDDSDAGANDRVDAAFDLAAAYRSRGEFATAIATLGSAAAVAETSQTWWIGLAMLGQLEADRGDLAKAEAHFAAAIDAMPADRAPIRPLFLWGLAIVDAGGGLSESEPWRQLTALEPDSDMDSVDQAATLAVLGSLSANGAEAVELVSRALNDDQAYRYVAYERLLALAYVKAGQPDAAIDVLTEWLAAIPPLDRIDLEFDREAGRRLLRELTDAKTARHLRRSGDAPTRPGRPRRYAMR